MSKHPDKFPRRRFLIGAGGVTLGLPMLDIFMPKKVSAQTAAQPPFVLIVVQANGVVQAGRGIDGSTDPENFWPTRTGALTTAALDADKATRATGVLSAHAARLTLVRGINHPFTATGCMHASGDAQILTAAKLSGDSNKVLATARSVDSYIATSVNPAGREPLVLHAGKYSPGGTGFDIPGYVSYIGPTQPRTYLDGPYKAYQRITGVVGPGGTTTTTTGPTQAQQLAANRSKSINDLLRTQIKALQARTDLSASDRVRIDQHLTTIRDLEVQITTMTTTGFAAIPAATLTSMQQLDPKPYDMTAHFQLVQLHMQLMIFAIASGYTRVAVLKIGDREDDHELTIGGTSFMYHTASHRGVPNGASLCSQVDFMHQGYFKAMLDQLAATTTPTGALIDAGVTVWTNQCASGNHSFVNVPWILAGRAGGYLKVGQYVDVSGKSYMTNRMLNVLANAAGVRKTGGAIVDDFGDPGLTKGVVTEIVA